MTSTLEPHPKLIEWLKEAGFTQHPDKLGLYRAIRTIPDPKLPNVIINLTAYVDFRRDPKGQRYTSDARIDKDSVDVLKAYKNYRDTLLNKKLVETSGQPQENSLAVKFENNSPAIITQDVIKEASKIAKTLADIVDKTKMFKTINGKKYVYVDGWETLGAMMHCRSEVTDIQEYKDGYKAFVTIFDQSGKVLSKGSAICTRQEKNWKDRDEYAIYSMAQTRALGKAYRLGMSWIMSLAGYESTPAEETE